MPVRHPDGHPTCKNTTPAVSGFLRRRLEYHLLAGVDLKNGMYFRHADLVIC